TRFVDLAEIFVGKRRAERAHAVANVLKSISVRSHREELVHAIVAVASIASRPSLPFAHSAIFPLAPSGRPQTAKGALSNSGLTARKSKRVTRASGRCRSRRSSSSVANNGPCTTRPG